MRTALLAGSISTLLSCVSDSASVVSAMDSSTPGTLPGPLPGWEKEFDGTTCAHPPVEADCQNGWCRIPAGCFIKGSPETELGRAMKTEEQRAVTLTHSFWIQQHEVTQREWTAHGLSNPSGMFPDRNGGDCTTDPGCPVGNVTWFEAAEFANLMSQAHTPPLPSCYELGGCTNEMGQGRRCESVTLTAPIVYECDGYRLLTDAEYEYAVRAGTSDAFYSGPITQEAAADPTRCNPYEPLMAIAWYCGNAGRYTHPVGSKRPNSWHVYDMTGNAEEWVHDEETGQTPPPGPLTDPGGTMRDYKYRQTRGASAIAWPVVLRSANRALSGSWDIRFPMTGFRLARTVPRDPQSADAGP
jgi:formylglycine-generating enzyme